MVREVTRGTTHYNQKYYQVVAGSNIWTTGLFLVDGRGLGLGFDLTSGQAHGTGIIPVSLEIFPELFGESVSSQKCENSTKKLPCDPPQSFRQWTTA